LSIEAPANVELRRSFAWRTFAAAAGMASTFLLSVIIVRSLDLHEAAAFFAILASVSFGPLIGRLGLGHNVIRLMRAEPASEVRRQIAATHLFATMILSSVSAPVVALIGCHALLGHSNFWPVFVLTTLLIAVEAARLMVSDIFAAAGRVRASVATMHYVRTLLTLPLVAIVVFAVHRPSLTAVVAAYLIVSVLQFTAALIHARHDVAVFRLSTGIETLRTAVRQGMQLFSLDFSEFMLKQGTIWLAATAFSPLAATQYSAAVALAMQVTVLESLCGLAVAPPAARLWAAGEKDQVVRMLSNAATLNTVVAVVLVVMLAILGPIVLELAYGSEMRPASAILLIVAASGIFQATFDGSIILLVAAGCITAAARTAMGVVLVALPCAVAAAWFGGPIPLAVVVFLGVAAKSIGQWITARRLVESPPCATFHVVRAARGLMRDRDDDPQVSDCREEILAVPKGGR
jgi:O-antigen/teichoic acid export membrane protein